MGIEKRPGKRNVHVVMPCNIIHIMALGERIVHITNFGILHIS
jgi:hypothetical protein